ncbi:uncharacterized protein LOC121375680 isoform X2 [Gigantopelta aegis]|uniref:uncharacterized protein LOC121375680 isoform X2 n=1 Tax=Gigantopelta aegis TaxID=1735272 RepID=UPI001B88A40D|nr:uncharacterized protein LOC121375680 isoform X2 [Gigantopelta aegis]
MMFQGHMCFRLCVIQAAVVHSLFSAPKLLFEANPVRQGGQYTYATGTTVELNCTIAVPGLNSSVLVLQGCQSHLPAKRNSTNTIIYVIKNGGSRNSGVYRCCIGQCDEGFSFTSNSRSLAISFGPLPPKPKNFSCVSDNFMSLKCRWDVSGTNNTSNFWISRFIYDRYVSGSCQNTSTSSHQFPCACSNIALRTGINEMKPLMCSMKSGIHKQGPFFQFKNYWIQVWGYNPFGDVFWNYSVFTDTSIVKLPPVSILHADARNSSSIQVVWDLRSTIQIDITFEVAIRNLRSRDQRQSFQNITTTTKMASLENLRPFTNYSVQVRSRPNGGCYWSDSRSVNVTTMEDSPSSAPVSTPGAYSRISCEESMDCVWLYWKPIEELSRNGIITKYIINSSSTRHQSTIKQPDPKKDTFSSQLQWSDKGADHDIFIRGQTSKGPSPTYHLHVPNDTKAPKKPRWVVVEVLNTSCETYQITWPAQSCDYSPNDSLTIFWCLGVSKRSHVNCKAALDWVVLPPNTTMYTVSPHTDKNVSTILSWFFGVAVHKNNSSSGITWNKCIFTFNGGASKPVSLFASPVNLTYVEVSWHFSYCDTTQVQGKPEEYLVAYNKVQPGVVSNCTGGLHKSEPASFDSNSMFLTDLDYNVNYQVCMRIKTRVGFSPYSDPVQVEMKPPAADSNVEVIIGVSVSFGIVVIIFTVWRSRRKEIFTE